VADYLSGVPPDHPPPPCPRPGWEPRARDRHWTAAASVAGVLTFLLLAAPIRSALAIEVAQEYSVKAAFLVSFSEFIEWPPESATAAPPIIIGVLGRDPFGPALDSIVATKNAADPRFVVRRYPRVEEVEACHILFIGPRDEKSVREAIRALGGRPTLTVGETEVFGKCGGMINFYVEDDRVRFEINPEPAEQANLKISAKLMRLQKKPGR
jgi:hypothetical protein